MDRFEKVKYTLEHRKAFRKIEKQLFGKNTFRSLFHDLDKVILYPILGVEKTRYLHRKYSRHHLRAHTYKDFCQQVIDWESCRYTKPDKPLNAYETLYKYFPEREDEILPILKMLGIDHPLKKS